MTKKPKKLKKISPDIVRYVRDEGKAVKTAIDKDLILSYAKHKYELVEWYISVLEKGSKDYIVPQSLAELNKIGADLLTEIVYIETEPLPPPRGTIVYPKGYEG